MKDLAELMSYNGYAHHVKHFRELECAMEDARFIQGGPVRDLFEIMSIVIGEWVYEGGISVKVRKLGTNFVETIQITEQCLNPVSPSYIYEVFDSGRKTIWRADEE